MKKKYYPKPEFAIIFFIILGIIFLILPFSFENARQASFISKWNEKFNRVKYTFSVINAHISDEIIVDMKNSNMTPIFLTTIKPYMRINTEKRPPRRYKPKFLNGNRVPKNNNFYFDDFYYADNNTIIGIKNSDTENLMMFDINGLLPPNRWGQDIYGIYVYDKGRIEPLGYDQNMPELKKECSQSGIFCSYYYIIGGEFND